MTKQTKDTLMLVGFAGALLYLGFGSPLSGLGRGGKRRWRPRKRDCQALAARERAISARHDRLNAEIAQNCPARPSRMVPQGGPILDV